MRNRIYLPLLFILTSLILSACGGGSSSKSTPTAITGSYSDAGAVSGLQYSTATQSGTTDSSGKFLYLPGETVTFSVGSIVIGKAVAAPTLTTFDLVGISAPLTSLGIPNNIPSSLLFQQAINISTFLQTLDSDGNVSNGISIPSQAIVLAKNTAVNFNQKYFYFQNSFALNNFIGRCRTAGIWGGSRVIVSSGYAANLLYAGLGLAPKLYAVTRADSGTNSYSLFTYDANGNMTQIKSFNGGGVLQSSNTFTYDANGNLTQSKSFNGSGVLQSSVTYTYDANGNMTAYQYFDSSGVLQFSVTYTYDANGNKTAYQYFDSSGVLQSSTTYTNSASSVWTQIFRNLKGGGLD